MNTAGQIYSFSRSFFSFAFREFEYQRLRRAQIGFLVFGVLFFLYLVASALLSSRDRLSLSSINTLSSTGEQSVIAHNDGDDVSKLRIQDFHRLEVKDGRPVWEIRARDANYFHLQATTHVNDATVTVYRPKQRSVTIHADVGRLSINGSTLLAAVLEGHVTVAVEDSLTAEAQHAEYQATSRVITAPDQVKIVGNGYQVSGEGMEMQIDTENIKIQRNAVSRFDPGAKVPAGVEFNKTENPGRGAAAR